MKKKIDFLIQAIVANQDSSDILDAKKDYQKISGEVYEDDKSYEARMGIFLEWYMFDRKSVEKEETPFQTFVSNTKASELTGDLKNVVKFSDNIHALFRIKKLSDTRVVAQNILDETKYDVNESEGKLLFHKNDLFEGRIVLIDGNYYFTGNFCFHPKEAGKFIKGEVKRINFIRDSYLKELKILNSKLNNIDSRREKNTREVQKINSKVLKSNSVDKIRSLNEKLEVLKKERSELSRQVLQIEADRVAVESQKNKVNELFTHLIQKLSYMNLKWERSRQMDLNDIYRN